MVAEEHPLDPTMNGQTKAGFHFLSPSVKILMSTLHKISDSLRLSQWPAWFELYSQENHPGIEFFPQLWYKFNHKIRLIAKLITIKQLLSTHKWFCW
jgi:hypothetical protein